MLANDTLLARISDTLIGALIFFIIVTGATYYLQSSLIVFKSYGAYNHWVVILIAVPVIAGLVVRQARILYPLFSAIIGALASAALLYQFYKSFWAVPPTQVDLIIYTAIIMGIGFIATQPLRTTVMIAFRLGRFSVPRFKSADTIANNKTNTKTSAKSNTKSTTKANTKKTGPKTPLTNTQRLQTSEHGNVIAMLELVVGLTSLALSIFSIFFLGRS